MTSSETTRLFLGKNIKTSSLRNLFPKSIHRSKSPTVRTTLRSDDIENISPIDPNVPVNRPVSIKPPPLFENSEKDVVNRSKMTSTQVDAPVKVVVRIRPVNDNIKEGDWTVRKVTSDSLSVGDRKFTFDSVLDSKSNQEEIFQLVGVPSVKSALAGYNTSILLYGQTGSGKTYTMWGPPSAMVQDLSPSSHQGIVPRIFQMLFSEIERREQKNLNGKQLSHQCRCSFLEVYNEQIGDLLDPTKRNLQIRDDTKNGFYVENLTEEYVTSYEDVTQILIKGLSNRKVGATSINSKSSRSHIVFTCIIDSWCEGTTSKCFSSSRTSRLTLVDLAGMETRKLDVEDSSRQRVKEGKSVKKTLSQLGYLVNSLAKGPQSADIPYKKSCLTHLMRESLGGNAKLTVICAISPDNKSTGETLSTLRFGQRAKLIKNEPVINEITEDDVNDLSDQIRQLKEELKRAKSSGSRSIGADNGYFKGRNVRDSLNQLRVGLNRSLILPCIDDDHDEDMDVVDEEDVKELCLQLDNFHYSDEENSTEVDSKGDSIYFPAIAESSDTYISCADDGEIEEMYSKTQEVKLSNDNAETLGSSFDPNFRRSISISTCRQVSALQEPILSESPKINNGPRKSMAISSNCLASQNMSDSVDVKRIEHIRSSLQSSNAYPGPADSLAASLQRGLQIIDHHQRNSTLNKSTVSFSFEHLALTPCPAVDIGRASLQTLSEEVEGKDFAGVAKRKELEILCKEQASKIEELNSLVDQYKHEMEQKNTFIHEAPINEIVPIEEPNYEENSSLDVGTKLVSCNYGEDHQLEMIKEQCEIKEIQEVSNHEYRNPSINLNEKEALLKEIETLRSKLQSVTDAPCINKSVGRLRSSLLLSRSVQLQKICEDNNEDELERERERWTEMESDWISLTDELRIDLENYRRRAEKVESELKVEKNHTEELNDVVHRSVLGHARMIEHYADLQEKHNELVEKHRMIMAGISEVKRAAAKAGAKGHGARFSRYMSAELSTLRVEKEKEREFLKKENKSLRIQLRETAEAVHAAGELLVRLREAEETASISETNVMTLSEENEKLKKQMEKTKRKHKMEMVTMKQYLAESRLPESALLPSTYQEDSNNNMMTRAQHNNDDDDDEAWRAEFGAIYQDHHY